MQPQHSSSLQPHNRTASFTRSVSSLRSMPHLWRFDGTIYISTLQNKENESKILRNLQTCKKRHHFLNNTSRPSFGLLLASIAIGFFNQTLQSWFFFIDCCPLTEQMKLLNSKPIFLSKLVQSCPNLSKAVQICPILSKFVYYFACHVLNKKLFD